QTARRVNKRAQSSYLVSAPELRWFVRSMADGDTHRGYYSQATRSVHAVCGAEFVPLRIGLAGDRLALPGTPPDPAQVCPKCRRV
ncbi:MAG: hypothetical protein M3325_06285, partial [Actinomycetota bacterium]|nr:hypothetical protein [Actinomycetota bacterium]